MNISLKHRMPERNVLFSAIVLLIYTYFLPRYAFPSIWEQIYYVYYFAFASIFMAFTLYFRRFNEFIEVKLILFFWLWVYITRLLNGDFFLNKDSDIVLNSGMIYIFLLPCIVLKGKAREKFLDIFSIITAGYYTLLAFVGLYAVLLQREMYNPLTGDVMCSFYLSRIYIFSRNPNESCMWFFIAFFALAYLFIKWKNPLLRLAVAGAALLNYLVMGMTFSRNAMLAFALSFALLVPAVFLHKFKLKSFVQKLLVTLAMFFVLAPLTYLATNECTGLVYDMSTALTTRFPAEELAAEPEALAAPATLTSFHSGGESATARKDMSPEPLSELIKDFQVERLQDRGLNSSGRVDIYKTVIPTLKQEPLRLIRGCLCLDVMEVANTILPNAKPHMHNTFLQILNLTGLPGLLLLLGFCLLVAYHVLRLFFSDCGLHIKVLTLSLVGMFSYNMLEVALFVATDPRSLTTYIIVGAAMAYSYELKPAPLSKRKYQS